MAWHCGSYRRVPPAAALLLLLWAVPAAAQDTGTITGTVVDNQKQVIPGASVTLTHELSGSARTATSDPRGEFTFQGVAPATYTVKVELSGFKTFERRGNVLNASTRMDLGRLVLDVGPLTETITVEATGARVETSNSDYSGLLTSTQISQIQTKGRDVMSLLRLLPGVRYEDDIEAMGESFGSNVPHIAGQRRAWNQITVDGLNGNELSGTSRFASATNLDAIAEVKVLHGSYKAEYGRSGGGNVKIVTKGGGQRYTGSTYYFARRDKWNENRWENIQANQPIPKYNYDTFGANIGGPAKVRDDLFFFYSVEKWRSQQPGDLRRFLVPTEAERNGDFSNLRDSSNRIIHIRDPLRSGSCHSVNGGPGCFPGNIVPQDRIDRNGQALLKMLPAPNFFDRAISGGNYNFVNQETPDKPRLNHVATVDWRPTTNDHFRFSFNSFDSLQTGSEITAGPSRWGYFDGTYDFGNKFFTARHTRTITSNLVNELVGGVRRQTEGFGWGTDADLDRIRRDTVGFNVGQFNPHLNPLNLLPEARITGTSRTGSSILFGYDTRIGEVASDYIASVDETLTWLKGRHALKGGFYFEYLRNHEARGGIWNGRFDFRSTGNNPLNTNHGFSNTVLGVFQNYTEVDNYRSTRNNHLQAEWYVQDTWRAANRLTLDYGMRFLWFTPYWQANERTAAFVPDRWDPANAPRMYQPARINNQNVALDPVTGQTLNQVYIGTFVPGSGDPANGMVSASDRSYPRGFRDNPGIHAEPRLGLAYDLFGNGKTRLHAGAGLFHQATLGGGSQGNLQGPPNFNEVTIYYNTLADFMAPGTTLTQRPVSVRGLERDAKTPSATRWTAGVQQDIGWGTIVGASYVGSINRHLYMERNINEIPPETRFLDINPQNRDPRNVNNALPSEFLRPYPGFQDIVIGENWGTGKYNSLQLEVARRYIKGIQFSGAYTYAKAYGYGDEDGARVSIFRPLEEGYWGPLGSNQTHNLVVSYTIDLPNGSRMADNHVTRVLLDGWLLSGENAWVTGDWATVTQSFNYTVDFTGGQEGARPNMIGNPELSRGERDAETRWLNAAAFTPPSGRGDIGDAPRLNFRQPGVNNWNLAIFKNFSMGGPRAFQLRVEAYNVLNTVQFREVDRGLRWDPQGNQINPNFGKASRSRNPRIMQISARFNF
jgi:hypothetical protein